MAPNESCFTGSIQREERAALEEQIQAQEETGFIFLESLEFAQKIKLFKSFVTNISPDGLTINIIPFILMCAIIKLSDN